MRDFSALKKLGSFTASDAAEVWGCSSRCAAANLGPLVRKGVLRATKKRPFVYSFGKPEKSAVVAKLKRVFGDEAFSVRDVAKKLFVCRRRANKICAKAVKSGAFDARIKNVRLIAFSKASLVLGFLPKLAESREIAAICKKVGVDPRFFVPRLVASGKIFARRVVAARYPYGEYWTTLYSREPIEDRFYNFATKKEREWARLALEVEDEPIFRRLPKKIADGGKFREFFLEAAWSICDADRLMGKAEKRRRVYEKDARGRRRYTKADRIY